jgi:hypothetical protein
MTGRMCRRVPSATSCGTSTSRPRSSAGSAWSGSNHRPSRPRPRAVRPGGSARWRCPRCVAVTRLSRRSEGSRGYPSAAAVPPVPRWQAVPWLNRNPLDSNDHRCVGMERSTAMRERPQAPRQLVFTLTLAPATLGRANPGTRRVSRCRRGPSAAAPWGAGGTRDGRRAQPAASDRIRGLPGCAGGQAGRVANRPRLGGGCGEAGSALAYREQDVAGVTPDRLDRASWRVATFVVGDVSAPRPSVGR